MASLGVEAWVMIGLVIVAGILGMLYALSADIRDFHRVLALKSEVERLKVQFADRVSELRAQQMADGPARDQHKK